MHAHASLGITTHVAALAAAEPAAAVPGASWGADLVMIMVMMIGGERVLYHLRFTPCLGCVWMYVCIYV